MATTVLHGATKRKVIVQQRLQSGPLRHVKATKKERVSDKKSTPLTETLLRYKEVKGDLFSCPTTSSLGHCVSEDMAMGKGVATLFKKNFGGVGELRAQGVKTGGVAVLKQKDRYIYYLVTKPRSFHKPTYESLRSSLSAMKAHCVAHDVQEVCLPRIGCGLDRLKWENVSSMLQEIFGDMDMTMTVYYL